MNSAKKIILFDIDYTLWHTDDFRDLFFPLAAKESGYSREEFIKLARFADQETKNRVGYFQPDTWLAVIQEKAHREVSQETLEKIFWTESFYHDVLDKEITTVLPELQKKGYAIGIFSTGEHTFQRKKIETIQHLLHDEYVYIVTNKIMELETILQRHANKRIIIVDDLPKVLAAVKQYNPHIITILRQSNKRYEQTEHSSTFKPDYTITTLKELLTIL